MLHDAHPFRRIRSCAFRRSRWGERVRRISWVVSVTLALGAGIPAQAQTETQQVFSRIAAGPLDGTTYDVAVALATLLSAPLGGRPCDRGGSCGVPGLLAVAQGAEDGVDAVRQVLTGQADFAIAALDKARDALAKAGKASDGVTSVATLFSQDMHVIVRQDSPYQRLADLRGRTVTIAVGGERTSRIPRLLLAENKITPRRPLLAPLDMALQDLRESLTEAVLLLATPGQPALIAAAGQAPLRLLALGLEEAPAALRPSFVVEPVPGGLYPGMARVETLVLPFQLYAAARLPEPLVRDVTASLWHPAQLRAYAEGIPALRDIRRETALSGQVIPLHPGAASFYGVPAIPAGN